MRHSNLAARGSTGVSRPAWDRHFNQLVTVSSLYRPHDAQSVGFGGAGRINRPVRVALPWREASFLCRLVGWLVWPACSGHWPVVQWISGEKWDGPPGRGSGAARARQRRTPQHLTAGNKPDSRDRKWESADKPGSVEGNHPSGTRVAARLERPTRKLLRAAGADSVARVFPYLVLLQVGFAVPPNVATGAVRSYRTLSPLPSPHCCDAWAVCSLLHFPWARAPQALPGTLPCGARTFLCHWRSGCLADSRADYTGAVRSRSARS